VDFDILATEKRFAVDVNVRSVNRLVGGKNAPQAFVHGAIETPSDSSKAGTREFPRVTRVILSPTLKKNEETRLRFAYVVIHSDPARSDLDYRLVALLPDSSKEICLMSDFEWLPRVQEGDGSRIRDLMNRNFWPLVTKPRWKLSMSHPADYTSMVVDGRLVTEERIGSTTTSDWVSRAPGLPQLVVGHASRVEVRDKGSSVVFFLPKSIEESLSLRAQRPGKRCFELPDADSNPDYVHVLARFILQAKRFYSDLFGSLNGDRINVAVTSCGLGGHGAYLGMFLDAGSFQRKWEKSQLQPSAFFDETVAHELAHSWWGGSITSYGRGTRWLRESFSNFAAWHLARELYHRDRFCETVALLLYNGTAKDVLFGSLDDNFRLSYTKGAVVVDILRGEMGDELFFRAIKTFTSKYRDSCATFTDFLSVCNDVSLRDWTPFFNQWCYGDGFPIYKLVQFSSVETDGGWETSVRIRNEGKGSVACPLRLSMEDSVQDKMFRISGGSECTLKFYTSRKVDTVIIDPLHNTFQGDERESHLKMLALKGTTLWEWMAYWIGIASAQERDLAGCVELTSQAIDSHEKALGIGRAHPAMYYSRGIAHLQNGEREKAKTDLRLFFDRMIVLAREMPGHLDQLIGTLAYAGIVKGTQVERREQLSSIVGILAGVNISLDSNLDCLRRWWDINRECHEFPAEAASLTPAGIQNHL